jgi:hypothetical protein
MDFYSDFVIFLCFNAFVLPCAHISREMMEWMVSFANHWKPKSNIVELEYTLPKRRICKTAICRERETNLRLRDHFTYEGK